MGAQSEHIGLIFANRCYQYRLLQHIFGNEPSQELMDITISEHTQKAITLYLDESDFRFEDYFIFLAGLKQELKANPDAVLDKLKDEYTRLFIGPNLMPAPPWESVYTSQERALFQPSTLEVRRSYAQYQFLPVGYPHEADDHLALELDFMFHLAQIAQTGFEEGNIGEAKEVLANQKEFLDEHLLNWVGCFAADIQKSRTQHFYPQTALLTEQLLLMDREILDELISIL